MSQALRILLLEDDPADALLIERALLRLPFACVIDRVETGDEFARRFHASPPDLVLSDHRLASFSGMHALEFIRRSAPDLPFIFVTGALDEETAVECVKAGAWDYVLKDRLVRLAPAVMSAVELQRTRQALKDSQEQLMHTQRMDALGRLASGVAHDYNNIVTAIVGYAALLAETMDDDPRREDVDEIRLAGERAMNLTRQLLAFSRKQAMTVTAIQLNDVVLGVDRLIRRLVGKTVRLDVNLAAELPTIDADQSQLEQVIVNLAVNAGDAMPAGGTLTLTTELVDLDEAYRTKYSEAECGSHVLLVVRDTGTGIRPDVLPRIFEPFFTTKPRGHGTGLGLATVYGAVRQLNGHVTVTSSPGEGTEFRVYLPVGSERPFLVRPAMARRTISLAGTETILIVEADESVRGLAFRAFHSRGYQVLQAGSYQEAEQILRGAIPIDALVVDRALIDGSGVDVARLAHTLKPDICVLLTSTLHDLAEAGGPSPDAGGIEILTKPFTPVDLLGKTRELLDRKHTSDSPPTQGPRG